MHLRDQPAYAMLLGPRLPETHLRDQPPASPSVLHSHSPAQDEPDLMSPETVANTKGQSHASDSPNCKTDA